MRPVAGGVRPGAGGAAGAPGSVAGAPAVRQGEAVFLKPFDIELQRLRRIAQGLVDIIARGDAAGKVRKPDTNGMVRAESSMRTTSVSPFGLRKVVALRAGDSRPSARCFETAIEADISRMTSVPSRAL